MSVQFHYVVRYDDERDDWDIPFYKVAEMVVMVMEERGGRLIPSRYADLLQE